MKLFFTSEKENRVEISFSLTTFNIDVLQTTCESRIFLSANIYTPSAASLLLICFHLPVAIFAASSIQFSRYYDGALANLQWQSNNLTRENEIHVWTFAAVLVEA